MKMTEVTQDIVDLIIENKDKSDNDILGIIIGAGVPFNKAKGVLNSVLIEQGLRMTKEQRDEKAAELMESFSVSEDTTSDEVAEQVELLADELNCSAGVARAYVRAAFAEEDIEMPKAKRTGGGHRGPRSPGFSGDAKITTDFLIENPDCTKEEFSAHMEEKGIAKTKNGADKTSRWYSYMQDLKIFANKWCEAGNCDK